MNNCNCNDSLLIGAIVPILINLGLILLIVLYSLYLTYRDHSIDLRQWKITENQKIQRTFSQKLNRVDNTIAQLEKIESVF